METPPPGFLLEPEGVGVAMLLAARTTGGLRIEDTAKQCYCNVSSKVSQLAPIANADT